MKKFTKLEWLKLCVREEEARLKQMQTESDLAFADTPKKKTKTKSKFKTKSEIEDREKYGDPDNFWGTDDEPEFWNS